MQHTVLRKRLAYPANTPQGITAPPGVRHLRVRLEGTPAGAQVVLAFNERDLLLGQNTFRISSGSPLSLSDIWVPGGKLYFLGQRSRPGVHLRFDFFHVGPDVYAYQRHRLVPDPRVTPRSTDLGGSWPYAPHNRAWMHENLLPKPKGFARCLIGNVATVYPNAESTSPYLLIPQLISAQGSIPSGATIREIRPSFRVRAVTTEDAAIPGNAAILESLRLVKGFEAQTPDYASDQLTAGTCTFDGSDVDDIINLIDGTFSDYGEYEGQIVHARFSEDASGTVAGLTDGEDYITKFTYYSAAIGNAVYVLDANLESGNTGTGHQLTRLIPKGRKWPILTDTPSMWHEAYSSFMPLWNDTWTPEDINHGFGLLLAFSLQEYTEEEGALYIHLTDVEVNVYYTL